MDRLRYWLEGWWLYGRPPGGGQQQARGLPSLTTGVCWCCGDVDDLINDPNMSEVQYCRTCRSRFDRVWSLDEVSAGD